MTAVIQSPPHEIARQEKLAHLAAVNAREELQRRHSQGQADASADAEAVAGADAGPDTRADARANDGQGRIVGDA